MDTIGFRKNIVILHSNMGQKEIIELIKETAARVLPANSSLWLYGSRARGGASPGSDYDLLILVDSETITPQVESAAYELCLMGYDNNVEINPHIYQKNKWKGWTFTPFYKNVERDKVVLM